MKNETKSHAHLQQENATLRAELEEARANLGKILAPGQPLETNAQRLARKAGRKGAAA